MSRASLEERVNTLEDQVRELMDRLNNQHRLPNWQATAGMFKNDPVMQEIIDEGRRIREEDRERARRNPA